MTGYPTNFIHEALFTCKGVIELAKKKYIFCEKIVNLQ